MKNTLDLEDVELPSDPRYLRFLARLPHVYSSQEAEFLLRLPYGFEGGLPGLATQMLPPFASASQRYDPVVVERRLAPAAPRGSGFGRSNPRASSLASPSDEGLHWHSIPVRDLTKHALIVGSTGSGKTVTTLFLMRELLRLNVPFLVIEPVKTEYFEALKSLPEFTGGSRALRRFRFEGNKDGEPADDFLPVDLMRLQFGVSVARHVWTLVVL